MQEFQENNFIKILNLKRETEEIVFNKFKNEIDLTNNFSPENNYFNINGSQIKYIKKSEEHININLMNYILKSKNNLIYTYVMNNYKDKIEFKNSNSYYAFLIELLNQKKIKDFLYFFQYEKNFSSGEIVSNSINKLITKKDFKLYSSKIEAVYNLLLEQSLQLDNSEIYNYLINNKIYSEKRLGMENYKVKKWFINNEILEITPDFLLNRIDYKYKDKFFYEKVFDILRSYNSYNYKLSELIIKNNNNKPSKIIKDFQEIIKLKYSNDIIHNYFRNNIINSINYFSGEDFFTDKEYKQIANILKEYIENNSNLNQQKNKVFIFTDFFFRHNFNVSPSINYTKNVPYRFKGNQKLYKLITDLIPFEDKQEIPLLFLKGIFKDNFNERDTYKKVDLIENMSTIEDILKEHSLTLSSYKDFLRINSILLSNKKIENNLYKYADENIYIQLHKENKNKEKRIFTNKFSINELTEYFNSNCFYAANTKEMEESILKKDNDIISNIRELAIIKIYTKDHFNNINESLNIDNKIEFLINKTNIISKVEFNNFIIGMRKLIKDNSTNIENCFNTLFEKINLKENIKNLEIDNIKRIKKRI